MVWAPDASDLRSVPRVVGFERGSSLRLGGKSHRLHVYAPESVFNDLGEGIRQTLLADLTFDGLPAAPSSVGLELRIG